MGGVERTSTIRRRAPRRARLLLALSASVAVAVPASDDPRERVRQGVAAACEDPSAPLAEMADRIPGARGIAAEPLVVRGIEAGWKRRFELPSGAVLRVERFMPRGQLRRVAVEYWAPAPGGGTRPALAAIAGARCEIRLGRRLVYEADAEQAVAVVHLDAGLEPTGRRAPLNPAVPVGSDPGGVAVALVDAGVNYQLPRIAERLARDEAGTILGYDFWDMDRRPFDANPARSPFFPERHGTKTASLLLREAPGVRLVPYRYPRPDMDRMAALVDDAAAHGIRIVNVSLGSGEREEWAAFAEAARAHPDMLFVVSAGNNGRDIDARPVYPAALELANIITVTSAENDGAIAPGSNWGRDAVDLSVPAERLRVTGFDGSATVASGSSYAVIRVTALAARLLARHPDWRTAELKDAILARVLPPLDGGPARVAAGFMPRPDKAEERPPLTADGELREVGRRRVAVEAAGADAPARATLAPTLAFFDGPAWTPAALRRHAETLARILGQCGIRVPAVELRTLAGPNVYHYFHERIASDLASRLEMPAPTVWFVRDTLAVNAWDAVAFGKANTTNRPALRYTVWFTEDTRDPGVALAHELAHVLMDSGRHVDTPGNLMRAETSADNTALAAAQCDAIVDGGTANGLLTEAPG